MRIETTIYVEPTPKGRPRVATKGGRTFVYTPQKTVHAENLIRQALLDKGIFSEGIPLRLEATFYRPKPKSLPKRVTMPVARPDLVNYSSLLCDALEKFVYQNDAQIVDLLVRKRFGSPPRIELSISNIDEDVSALVDRGMAESATINRGSFAKYVTEEDKDEHSKV